MGCNGTMMHWGFQWTQEGSIVLGGVHDGQDCFHPLALVGESKTVSLLVFPRQEDLRGFVRQIATILVNLQKQVDIAEGLQVADVMAQVDAMFRQHGAGEGSP